MAPVRALQNAKDLFPIDDENSRVFLLFTADWNGHARLAMPTFKEYAEVYPDIAFWTVDVDSMDDVASDFGIAKLPTFVALKGGNKVGEFTMATAENIVALLDKLKVA